MAGRGIDITAHSSKSFASLDAAEFDYVITLCAEEICPWLPGKLRSRPDAGRLPPPLRVCP